MKRRIVILGSGIDGFNDDKEQAKVVRTEILMPTLEQNRSVVIDFKKVKTSTQSFMHALLGEVLVRFRESALAKLEFRNCSRQVKTLVEVVVDYSLGGFTIPAADKLADVDAVKDKAS